MSDVPNFWWLYRHDLFQELVARPMTDIEAAGAQARINRLLPIPAGSFLFSNYGFAVMTHAGQVLVDPSGSYVGAPMGERDVIGSLIGRERRIRRFTTELASIREESKNAITKCSVCYLHYLPCQFGEPRDCAVKRSSYRAYPYE